MTDTRDMLIHITCVMTRHVTYIDTHALWQIYVEALTWDMLTSSMHVSGYWPALTYAVTVWQIHLKTLMLTDNMHDLSIDDKAIDIHWHTDTSMTLWHTREDIDMLIDTITEHACTHIVWRTYNKTTYTTQHVIYTHTFTQHIDMHMTGLQHLYYDRRRWWSSHVHRRQGYWHVHTHDKATTLHSYSYTRSHVTDVFGDNFSQVYDIQLVIHDNTTYQMTLTCKPWHDICVNMHAYMYNDMMWQGYWHTDIQTTQLQVHMTCNMFADIFGMFMHLQQVPCTYMTRHTPYIKTLTYNATTWQLHYM